MNQTLTFIIGVVVGGVVAWFLRKDRVVEKKKELEDEGKIEQIGRRGAAVRYRLKTNG